METPTVVQDGDGVGLVSLKGGVQKRVDYARMQRFHLFLFMNV